MIKQAGPLQWALRAPKVIAGLAKSPKIMALVSRVPAVSKIWNHAEKGSVAALKVMGVLGASEGGYYVGRNHIGDWIGKQLYGPNRNVLLNNPTMATTIGSSVIGAGVGGLVGGLQEAMDNDEEDKGHSVGRASLLGALGGGAVGATTPALFTMLGRRGL